MNSGNLNNVSGVVIPADLGEANLQIFTREGIQLTAKPLTEQQAVELISKTNGFAEDAVYTASSAKPLVLLISSTACCSVSGLAVNCMPSRVKICKFASPRSAGITTPDTLFKFPEFNFANEE